METGGRWTFKDIWGSAPDNVFTVVTDGRILHYDGKTWSPMETEKLPPMTGVFGLASDEIYACSRLGKILRYDGSTWKFMQTGTDTDVNPNNSTAPNDSSAYPNNSDAPPKNSRH